jgi:hypothetical protein
LAPPLLTFLTKSLDVQPHHLECLENIFVGAAPVGQTLINQFKEKAPSVAVREGEIIPKENFLNA